MAEWHSCDESLPSATARLVRITMRDDVLEQRVEPMQLTPTWLELPRRGITVLLIEHDMGFIAHLCDPVIVMAEGQVLTQGTFDEVRADHRVREAYLGRRAA